MNEIYWSLSISSSEISVCFFIQYLTNDLFWWRYCIWLTTIYVQLLYNIYPIDYWIILMSSITIRIIYYIPIKIVYINFVINTKIMHCIKIHTILNSTQYLFVIWWYVLKAKKVIDDMYQLHIFPLIIQKSFIWSYVYYHIIFVSSKVAADLIGKSWHQYMFQMRCCPKNFQIQYISKMPLHFFIIIWVSNIENNHERLKWYCFDILAFQQMVKIINSYTHCLM